MRFLRLVFHAQQYQGYVIIGAMDLDAITHTVFEDDHAREKLEFYLEDAIYKNLPILKTCETPT